MEVFKFRCTNPKCRQTLSIPNTAAGMQVRCAKCGQAFLVPLTIKRLLEQARHDEPKRKAG